MTWELLAQALILVVVVTGCGAFLIVMWAERHSDSHLPRHEIGIPDELVGTPKGWAMFEHFDKVHPIPVEDCEQCREFLRAIGDTRYEDAR